MNKIFKFAALVSVCMMAFASCAPEEISTDQFSDDAVSFAAFAPNPVARGGALRIVGSNLQKVTEVVIPGVDPITEIELVSEGKMSEIRVIVPVDGPEVGPVSIVTSEGETYTSLVDLTYSEPIVLTSFSAGGSPAMPGDVVTFKGDYLNNIKEVIFADNVYVTEFVSQTRYELKVAVPYNAVTGKLILGDVDENNNSEGLVANLFYTESELVIGSPTVTVANRGELKAGAAVTVAGSYLNMVKSVNFGGVDAEFTVAEDGKSLTAVLPSTSTDGDVVLVTYAGEELKAGAYTTLVPSNLAIAAASRYKAGLNAVVTGKDLDLVTGAALAGTGLSYTYADGKITFAIPANAVDGTVILTLANGKTVETDAIELVKPVIASVTPLELYAGDENITVSGTDLDLVTGVTLGGKTAEFTVADGAITVATDATSVSGKIVLSLANGVKVESADEIKMNYHALVIVKSMPSAEHIGAKVTLTGANFMLVENIYIGEEKVVSYFNRTDEEVSFVMPWNKVGSYNIYFDLLNGDREMLATPIEVLLEINYITGWEGETYITWGDGGRVYVPAVKFLDVKAGAKMRMYYTQVDQTWSQAQINYGDWTGLVFPEIGSNTLVPTDIYGWFSDGILDRCTEVTLTQEILDNIQAKKGNAENVTDAGIIIQGSDLTFTKIEILQEISQETTLWEGEALVDNWHDDYKPYMLSDAGQELKDAGAQAGQVVYFYLTPTESDWKLQIIEGHWGPTYASICAVGSDTEGGTFTEVDLAANGGKYGITMTQEMLDTAFEQKWWGGVFVMNGDNVKVTKITLL